MLIWGAYSKKIGTKEVDVVCPICQSPNLILEAYCKLRHVWFIPLCATDKVYFLRCPRCFHPYDPDKLTHCESIHDDKFLAIKYPWYAYLGLFLILVCLVWIPFMEKSSIYESTADPKQDKKTELNRFYSNPTKGSVGVIHSNEHKKTPYTCFVVEKVKKNSMIINQCKYYHSKYYSALYPGSEDIDYTPIEMSKEEFKKILLHDFRYIEEKKPS